MSQALVLSNLSYRVANLQVLRDLDLAIDERQYYAIAGVNGAGKSTLIRLVLDLIRPQSGSQIRIFGLDNTDPGCRDALVYLPEKFDVRKTVSGWQYVEFVAAVYGRAIDRKRVRELAERLDFPPDRLASRVASYSKGMVQKLGLLSCFMLERRLVILDEPLSGLDPRARYHFKELMQSLRERDHTVLYSTHLLSDAEELCDRFGILHDAEMKYQGTPSDCMQRYATDSLEKAYMACISD